MNQAGRLAHGAAWSATRPLASARALRGDTTEHLGCQRGHVHTLAGMRNVEHKTGGKGGVKSVEGRNTADTCLGFAPGDSGDGACFTMEGLA
jgi:hypothetical protein